MGFFVKDYPVTLSIPSEITLRAVPLQSVESKLSRTGEGEMAEIFAVSLAWLDFLARVIFLRDC